jgi:hypothetical protein
MGIDKAFDPARYFVVCANVMGSPYGSASPVTVNPDTGKPYGPEFPCTTIRDDVRCVETRFRSHSGANRCLLGYTSCYWTISGCDPWPSSLAARWVEWRSSNGLCVHPRVTCAILFPSLLQHDTAPGASAGGKLNVKASTVIRPMQMGTTRQVPLQILGSLLHVWLRSSLTDRATRSRVGLDESLRGSRVARMRSPSRLH